MIEKLEKDVGCFFDECARQGYMESFSSEELLKLKAAMERWNIRPGQRILEPGCGSGRLTEHLACAAGSQGEVFACDLSEEMLRLALKRKLPGHVTFFRGSVNTIPRGNNFFDTVICLAVFPHFSDRTLALKEILRVLKPCGSMWIEHLQSRAAINTLHKNSSDVIVSHLIPTENEMNRLLTRAGFEVAGIWDSEEGYRVHAVKKESEEI